jgi:predicted O-methyltransferase YrrM
MVSDIIVGETNDGFQAAGLNFKVVTSNYQEHKTNRNQIVVLKGADLLRSYRTVFEAAPNKRVLEFGIFEGGSTIYYALANPDCQIIAVDTCNPSEEVFRYIRDLGLSERVKLFYNTSQSDPDAIRRILAAEFKDEPLGIVMDDASHMYEYSRRSFELTFGRLAPGGFYCLEDWAWAHWGDYQKNKWVDKPALTNMVFELVMLYPSSSPLIDKIEITRGCVQISRGPRKIGEFSIDDLILSRGKKLNLI